MTSAKKAAIPVDLDEIRTHFLLDPSIVFLNHGSFGAVPLEVLDELSRLEREAESNPVAFMSRESASRISKAREALSCRIGAHPSSFAFVTNATTAVSIAARSVRLGPGDEVLATDMEYGACVRDWKKVCSETGALYREVRVGVPFDPEEFTERFGFSITSRTRVVFASAIASCTGIILPVEKICAIAKERGITTIIDGAHVPGHIELDLSALGADYYAGNLHKWMCAPKGTAFLHAAKGIEESVEPPLYGWGMVDEESPSDALDAYCGQTPLERRLLWLGTRDICPFLAVPSVLAFRDSLGWDSLSVISREKAREAGAIARDVLGTGEVAPGSSLAQMEPVPIPVEASSKNVEVVRRMFFEKYRIEIPVTMYHGMSFARVSFNAYNRKSDIDAFADALKNIFKR